MSLRNWLSNSPPGVIAAWWGWTVALLLAVACSADFVASRLATHDFQADEIQCRAEQKQEYAKRKLPTPSNQPAPAANSDSDPEKIARDYCVQRRSAIASETQAEVSKLSTLVSLMALLAAIAAICIAIWTGHSAQETASHAADAAEATERGVHVARETLTASHRAWLRRDKVSFSTPLDFRQFGIAMTSVQMEFTNVGNAPALHINKFAWLLTSPEAKVPEGRAMELFEEVKRNPVSGGFMLFPEQSYPRNRKIISHYSVHLSKAEVDAASNQHGRMRLYLAVCINYAFPADPNNNHQTCGLFEVNCTTDVLINRNRGCIPETELELLEAGFFGADIAN